MIQDVKLKILAKICIDDHIVGCEVVNNIGNVMYIPKEQLKMYKYTNAKISTDNKIIGEGIPIKQKNVELQTVKNEQSRDIILYHGSHRGIKGNINATSSRALCDFGNGFYTGDYEKQAKMLISDDISGVLYTLQVSLDNLNVYNFTDDVLWALYVGINRGHIDLSKYKKLATTCDEIDKKDVIIGYIADDRMMFVFSQFVAGNLTDKALIACLQYVKLGRQYVFKTDKACKQIQIKSKTVLSTAEQRALKQTKQNMLQGISTVVDNLRRAYRRQGEYIDEILERYK